MTQLFYVFADVVRDVIDLGQENVEMSQPEILFGILCLRFAFSETAMDAVLELLKLNLDFSSVRSAADVLSGLETADIEDHTVCGNCGIDLIGETSVCAW